MITTIDPPGAARARHALVQQLVHGGAITEPVWRAAFEHVPRHLFVPQYYVPGAGGYEEVTGDVPDQYEEWLSTVYSDTHLVTRVTDGAVTSSASQPSLMACMLHHLDLEPGMRVLEIGTGTGFNAGLLRHHTGSHRVVSVDLDPTSVRDARCALDALGFGDIITQAGDGALGHVEHGPYDRIIATCRINRIPTSWLEQLTDTGRVLAPYGNGLLDLHPTGTQTAQGRFLPTPAAFMPMRLPGSPGVSQRPQLPTDAAEATSVSSNDLIDPDFRFLLSVALPDLVWQYDTDAEGTITAARVWTPDRSIAEVSFDTAAVAQQGPGRIWDHIHALLQWYQDRNRPDRTRYGVTVTDTTQHIWLDTTDSPVPQFSPGGLAR